MDGTMEIEIELSLDQDGRTKSAKNDSTITIDYTSKTVKTSLMADGGGDESLCQKRIDDLLLDCEIADCAIMPRTFWMPADGTKPRCALERMALDVFHRHTKQESQKAGGAEWWVQIRPSPKGIGRYSVLGEAESDGISFHWDKDEDLRELTGGTIHVHPHLSTVTYLTSVGVPTMVVNRRVHNITGEWIAPEKQEGYMSWPQTGKHLSFDGRYLHAAPPDLVQSTPRESNDKQCARRNRRVTFLVNVWLHHKPFNVEPFPESMLDKLSKDDGIRLFSNQSRCPVEIVELETGDCAVSKRFTWPMGGYDSHETISVDIPIERAAQQAKNGGNLQLAWCNQTGVQLIKDEPMNKKKRQHEETEPNDLPSKKTQT